jgi:predicted O-methyltransferase YrrM
LYSLARNAQTGPFAEIGRFKGGSTFVFASALPEGIELWSYDLHVALGPGPAGRAARRRAADAALERYGLAHKVHLLVADSRKVEPPGPLELLFIDGDHTYEGAKADFDRWGEFVGPHGHLLFHDAVDAGGYGNAYPGIVRLLGEVEANAAWQRRPGAGSIAHFVKG